MESNRANGQVRGLHTQLLVPAKKKEKGKKPLKQRGYEMKYLALPPIRGKLMRRTDSFQ